MAMEITLFDGKYIFNMVDFTASHVSSLQNNFPIKIPPLFRAFSLKRSLDFVAPDGLTCFLFFFGKRTPW